MRRLRHGDRRRRRDALTCWLLVRGRGDRPLERFHGDRVDAHSSSKRPSHVVGDRCVLYASVWQAVYGLAEVAGPAEHDPERARWAWRFPLRPVAVIEDLDRAIPAEEVGVFPSSVWRHSYIRLTEQQYAGAATAIRARAGCQAP
ncbi:MAG TPA: hypothetical protein VI408_00825 [Gaiellaceae bacterium]